MTAIDSSSIGNGVLGIGISTGSAAVGASVTSNDISNQITVEISDTDLTASSINLASQESATITAVAVGATGAQNFALGGSVVVNVINNQTSTTVGTTSNLSAVAGAVTVSSQDTSEINVGSGQVSIATSGPSIGAAVAINAISNSTISSIDSTVIHVSSGELNILADSRQKIIAVAAGGAGATSLALGGSVVYNTISNTTQAYLSNSGNVTIVGLTISAIDTPSIYTGAGVIDVSLNGSAIGASVAVNTISNTVDAYIDNSVTHGSGPVSVTAGWNAPTTSSPSSAPSNLPGGEQTQSVLSAQVVAVALSGSLGNWAAVAGAVPVNNLNNHISGYIQNSTVDAGAGDVTVSATNSASIGTGALGLAAGQDAGGAAVGSSNIESNLTAQITGSSVTSTGAITASAEQSALIETVAIGLGAAGSFSLGGSIEVNVLKNSTAAYYEDSTITGGVVSALALDQSALKTGVGSFSLSAGTSVGAALSSNTITGTIDAYLHDTQATASTGNVVVEATATPEIVDVAVGGAVSADVAVEGSITVNVITLSTSAYIATASTETILANSSIIVQAVEELKLSAGAGSVGAAGSAAVGVANTTLITNNSTTAYIGNGIIATGLANGSDYDVFTGTKNASGNLETVGVSGVSVTSIAFHEIVNVAAGGALAGSVGVAGSVPVEVINESSIAYIGANTQINQTGNANANQWVNLQASNTTDMVTVAGALGGAGAAGIGAGVDVGVRGHGTEDDRVRENALLLEVVALVVNVREAIRELFHGNKEQNL